jgi:hypothetical protein
MEVVKQFKDEKEFCTLIVRAFKACCTYNIVNEKLIIETDGRPDIIRPCDKTNLLKFFPSDKCFITINEILYVFDFSGPYGSYFFIRVV